MLNKPTFLGISMEPQKNRRLLVAVTYAILVACVVGPFIVLPSLRGRMEPVWREFLLIVLITVLLTSVGVFSRLLRPSMSGRRSGQMARLSLTPGPRDPVEPDERELAIRNAAYYRAFRVIRAYSITLVLAIPLWQELGLSIPRQSPLVALLLLFFMSVTLPQAIILWTEPDVPEEARV